MTQYEYTTLNAELAELAKEDFVRRLNDLGRDGWNMVAAVTPERHGYSHQVHFVFSRVAPV